MHRLPEIFVSLISRSAANMHARCPVFAGRPRRVVSSRRFCWSGVGGESERSVFSSLPHPLSPCFSSPFSCLRTITVSERRRGGGLIGAPDVVACSPLRCFVVRKKSAELLRRHGRKAENRMKKGTPGNARNPMGRLKRDSNSRRLKTSHAFEACSLDRSDIQPCRSTANSLFIEEQRDQYVTRLVHFPSGPGARRRRLLRSGPCCVRSSAG